MFLPTIYATPPAPSKWYSLPLNLETFMERKQKKIMQYLTKIHLQCQYLLYLHSLMLVHLRRSGSLKMELEKTRPHLSSFYMQQSEETTSPNSNFTTKHMFIPGMYSDLKPGGGGLADWVWPIGVLENGLLRRHSLQFLHLNEKVRECKNKNKLVQPVFLKKCVFSKMSSKLMDILT